MVQLIHMHANIFAGNASTTWQTNTHIHTTTIMAIAMR